MTVGCNAAQGWETGDFSMETKKNCKRRKENKMMREKMGNENITALDKTHYQETQQERLR